MSTIKQTIMSAKAATGVSEIISLVENFKTVTLTVSGASSPTGTIKFFAADSDLPPDPLSAQSPSNPWDYVQAIDLQSGAAVNGDTGIDFAGSADTRRFELNISGARWVGAVITAYTGGNYTILLRAFANASSY